MRLLYYITSHGYGHAARTAAVCNQLSLETEVVLRTAVPRGFFEEEIARPFSYAPASFDCGCLQTDGITVHVGNTVDAYRAIADRNAAHAEREAAWVKENRISLIASDIVPFAFEVAAMAGVPSVAATNFTWYTIYEEYGARYPEFGPCLDNIRSQYAKANLLLSMFPANEMPYFSRIVDIAPVGRVGVNVRSSLAARYGFGALKKIGMIYAGNFGMDAIPWKELEHFAEWEFFGLYALPGAPANYHQLSKKQFRYQDCIASADAMISKLGYGTCAECMLGGLPLVYLPRENFAEFPVLHRAMSDWGHGYMLSKDDFYRLSWDRALSSIAQRPRPARMSSDGALRCAREMEKLFQSHLTPDR